MSAGRGGPGAAASSMTPPSRRSMTRARSAARRALSSPFNPTLTVVTRGPVSGTLREHLLERLHLDAVEDALRDVRVAVDDRPHVGERVGVEHDQASALVEERTRELHAPRFGERVQ